MIVSLVAALSKPKPGRILQPKLKIEKRRFLLRSSPFEHPCDLRCGKYHLCSNSRQRWEIDQIFWLEGRIDTNMSRMILKCAGSLSTSLLVEYNTRRGKKFVRRIRFKKYKPDWTPKIGCEAYEAIHGHSWKDKKMRINCWSW